MNITEGLNHNQTVGLNHNQTVGLNHNQTVGLKRNTTDKYYTNPIAVEICINAIRQHLHISKTDLIIEPSAGDGAFIAGIKTLSDSWKFYDLEPEHTEVETQDYLKLDTSAINKSTAKICHIIGNPPFGRQSSLAIQFIKKSCEFCDSISFILPKSFKKESLKKSFSLKFHLLVEIDLPKKSFLVNGQEYNVDTIFQIWGKKECDRSQVEKNEPIHFKFVKLSEDPDISFRRVGVYAGKIDTDILKSEQSHYFIKFTNGKSIQENLEVLKQVHFEHNNTVGPKSISKPELINEFNKYL